MTVAENSNFPNGVQKTLVTIKIGTQLEGTPRSVRGVALVGCFVEVVLDYPQHDLLLVGLQVVDSVLDEVDK